MAGHVHHWHLLTLDGIYLLRFLAMVRKKKTAEEFNSDIPNRPLTPQQLANYLQISLRTIRRMLDDLPAIHIGGQIRFIPSEVIDALKKKPNSQE